MEQSPFDIDDLRLLAALAESETLAGAARALRINHASAWRRLGALEARLGVRLFDRTRSGYSATPAGEEATATAKALLEQLNETARRLTGQDIRPSGVVRVTTTEAIFGLVAPALTKLRTSHPEIVVEVVAANNFFTLTRRDADVALRPAEVAPEGLVGRRLASIASAAYAAYSYLAGRHTDDLFALDWLCPDDSLSHLRSAQWIAEHVRSSAIVLRANSLIALREAARVGVGVAVLPCFMADGDSGLVRLSPPIREITSSLWLLVHPDLRRMPRIRAVLDALADHIDPIRTTLDPTKPSRSITRSTP